MFNIKKYNEINDFLKKSSNSAKIVAISKNHPLKSVLEAINAGVYIFGENRVQEVSEITQGLKALAKELKVPVLALSQLSRAVESRDDKKPLLSDLRESGSIEQDADVVMFVYREAYYLENKQPKLGSIEHAEWQSKMNDVNGLADIILGKQRHGPTGTIKVEFEGIFTKFKDLTKN